MLTPWDIRAARRALGATLLALAVVWLVTAASDEGGLTLGARAGRTLPLAPVCSAIGVALVLGGGRVRHEVRALEALGRSPASIGRAAALGAALPSVVIALVIAASPRVDVAPFYPRAARGEVFVATDAGFESPTLGVRVDDDGEATLLDAAHPLGDADLPRGARTAAALATATAGLALALVAAWGAPRRSLLGARARRRLRARLVSEALGCALATLVAFQAAASGRAPAALAIAPPLALLGVALLRLRTGRIPRASV